MRMFEPLQKKTVVEDIINTLLEMIAKGELRPGHALPSERDLAAMLNVSRTSVREALKALSYNDILIVKPGSGTYLTEKALSAPTSLRSSSESLILKYQSDYWEVIEARRILDVELSVLAAERAQLENISELEDCVKHMRELLDQGSYEAYTLEDLSFHNLIARSSLNDYLYKVYSQLFPHFVELSRLGESVSDRHWPSYHQHVAILEAIKVGDRERVRALVQAHIDFCSESMVMYFRQLREDK